MLKSRATYRHVHAELGDFSNLSALVRFKWRETFFVPSCSITRMYARIIVFSCHLPIAPVATPRRCIVASEALTSRHDALRSWPLNLVCVLVVVIRFLPWFCVLALWQAAVGQIVRVQLPQPQEPGQKWVDLPAVCMCVHLAYYTHLDTLASRTWKCKHAYIHVHARKHIHPAFCEPFWVNRFDICETAFCEPGRFANIAMHACMHVCMHTYIRTYTQRVCGLGRFCDNLWRRWHLSMQTYIHTEHTYIHACCTHTCIHTLKTSNLWTWAHTTYMYTCILHACIHTCRHWIHTAICGFGLIQGTYTYTCMHANAYNGLCTSDDFASVREGIFHTCVHTWRH